MSDNKDVVEGLGWAGGITLTVIGFIFAEGWLVLTVKIFGFGIATLIVTAVPLCIAWFVIYASSGARSIGRFRDWLSKKEKALSGRAAAAVKGGKALVVLNTAVLLGPIVAAVLMLMLGVERRRVYLYSVVSAFLCAVIWCGLYAGIFWGIHAVACGR